MGIDQTYVSNLDIDQEHKIDSGTIIQKGCKKCAEKLRRSNQNTKKQERIVENGKQTGLVSK